MSRKGNCWDNAVAESFIKSLKTEPRAMLELAKQYIEIWYNRKSRYAAVNYATIEEFNNQINYKNVA